MSETVTLRFFGALRETLACDALVLQRVPATVEEMRRQLVAERPQWRTALEDRQLWVAVNQRMTTFSAPLQAGDEVALFPPVTGG